MRKSALRITIKNADTWNFLWYIQTFLSHMQEATVIVLFSFCQHVMNESNSLILFFKVYL